MESDKEEERHDRQLANIIKATHANLRKRVHDEQDDDKVWRDHVKTLMDKSSTSEYAKAMKSLSDDHWETPDRIEWLVEKLKCYFIDDGEFKFRSRLARRQGIPEPKLDAVKRNPKFRVLDVGSCHNPLKKFLVDSHEFDLTAIDLSPADESVIQADFLQLEIVPKNEPLDNQDKFVEESYDAVIFCLVLGYMPSPSLRLKALQNAIRLLKPFGLLLIVSPDSSHQGKNLNQRRSWRLGLAKLGLLRIYDSKLQHLHCSGYVKVEPREDFRVAFKKDIDFVENRLKKAQPELNHDCDNLFYIPQDKQPEQQS